jgi:hypothetical protein
MYYEGLGKTKKHLVRIVELKEKIRTRVIRPGKTVNHYILKSSILQSCNPA